MVGYGPRLVFGWFADRTERYWLTSIAGYAANLLAVPALALAGNWPLAAALVVAERAGRAMRKPPMEGHAVGSRDPDWTGMGVWAKRGARSGRSHARSADE
jgi:hypothetical protein